MEKWQFVQDISMWLGISPLAVVIIIFVILAFVLLVLAKIVFRPWRSSEEDVMAMTSSVLADKPYQHTVKNKEMVENGDDDDTLYVTCDECGKIFGEEEEVGEHEHHIFVINETGSFFMDLGNPNSWTDSLNDLQKILTSFELRHPELKYVLIKIFDDVLSDSTERYFIVPTGQQINVTTTN